MASPQTGFFALGRLPRVSRARRSARTAYGRRPGRRACASHGRRSAGSTLSPASDRSSGRRRARCVTSRASTGFNAPSSAPDGYDAAGDAARRRHVADRRVLRRRFRPVAGIVDVARRAAALAHEIVGWPYHHDLDLTGFIDGTENPTLVEATRWPLIPDGRSGEGGVDPAAQQWEHDAIAWEAMSVDAQEAVIGRRKADSEELDPSQPTSHVARTDQDTSARSSGGTSPYGTLPATGRSSWASARAAAAGVDAREHGRHRRAAATRSSPLPER